MREGIEKKYLTVSRLASNGNSTNMISVARIYSVRRQPTTTHKHIDTTSTHSVEMENWSKDSKLVAPTQTLLKSEREGSIIDDSVGTGKI